MACDPSPVSSRAYVCGLPRQGRRNADLGAAPLPGAQSWLGSGFPGVMLLNSIIRGQAPY